MDIDIFETVEVSVHSQNITHNLGKMAQEAGIYRHLWHVDTLYINPRARVLITPLKNAIKDMESRPDHYSRFNAKNGWGTYEQFLPWLKKLLAACEEKPSGKIEVSR